MSSLDKSTDDISKKSSTITQYAFELESPMILSSWLSSVNLIVILSLLGKVWYLIVSILDLCGLSYFNGNNMRP